MTLQEAYKNAEQADDAFDAAIIAAGYKSRWHRDLQYLWNGRGPENVVRAYDTKVKADRALHDMFVELRRGK